jgi:hypothetical protein
MFYDEITCMNKVLICERRHSCRLVVLICFVFREIAIIFRNRLLEKVIVFVETHFLEYMSVCSVCNVEINLQTE